MVQSRDREPKNLVGFQVARLRNEIELSQEGLAAKCQRMGWDVSRGIIAAIEGRVRCVTDRELVLLAEVFRVSLEELLPHNLTKLRHRAEIRMRKPRST
jgi:hypothetical protein